MNPGVQPVEIVRVGPGPDVSVRDVFSAREN
jgi:hypothetical protein